MWVRFRCNFVICCCIGHIEVPLEMLSNADKNSGGHVNVVFGKPFTYVVHSSHIFVKMSEQLSLSIKRSNHHFHWCFNVAIHRLCHCNSSFESSAFILKVLLPCQWINKTNKAKLRQWVFIEDVTLFAQVCCRLSHASLACVWNVFMGFSLPSYSLLHTSVTPEVRSAGTGRLEVHSFFFFFFTFSRNAGYFSHATCCYCS